MTELDLRRQWNIGPPASATPGCSFDGCVAVQLRDSATTGMGTYYITWAADGSVTRTTTGTDWYLLPAA